MLPAVMQIVHHFPIIQFQFLIYLSACQCLCASTRCCSHFRRPRLMSVSLSVFGKEKRKKEKMSAASHLLPFLSMSACVSVRIHHASLGVDQGENTSLFLPHSPSSSSSCPHLTLMAVGFLMRKWVSLCSVSIEGLQGG